MRLLITLLSVAAVAPAAVAHTLGPDEGFALQIAHQLTGPHHLPLMLLVAAGVIAAIHAFRRRIR